MKLIHDDARYADGRVAVFDAWLDEPMFSEEGEML